MEQVFQNPPIEPRGLTPLLIEELKELVGQSAQASEVLDDAQAHIGSLQASLQYKHDVELESQLTAALDFVGAYMKPAAKSVPFRVDYETVDRAKLWDTASAALRAHGVFIIDNYFTTEITDRAEAELSEIDTVARKQFETGEFLETDKLIVDHPTEPRITGFLNRAKTGKCYVFSRPEEDSGIVEVVNVEKAGPTIEHDVRPRMTKAEIVDALNFGASVESFQARHMNAYINATNPTTRGLHVDTRQWYAKGFLYLTDVDDLADGPFAYVPGTHLATSPMKRLCVQYNEQVREYKSPRNLEMDLQNSKFAYPVLAKRGTFILGYTCGIHRGMPRIGDTRREVLIQNYF